MYGLVNKAVKDLVVGRYGADAWARVQGRVPGCPFEFLAMQSYDDKVTYDLVASVCEELGASPAVVLQAFGEWWIEFTASEGYGELVERYGDDMQTFLDNLDDMHSRVGAAFPELRPPRFELDENEDGELELEYHSDREGLAPMVVGLLHGLAKRFGVAIELDHTVMRAQHGHDVFQLRLSSDG